MDEEKNYISKDECIAVDTGDGISYYDPVTGDEIKDFYEPFDDLEDDEEDTDFDDLEDNEEGEEESEEDEDTDEEGEENGEDEEDNGEEGENSDIQEGKDNSSGEGDSDLAEDAVKDARDAAADATKEAAEEAAKEVAEEVAEEVVEAGAEAAAEGLLDVYIAASPWSEIITVVLIIIMILVIWLFLGFLGDDGETDLGSCNSGTTVVIDPGHISENDLSTTQAEYDRDEANGSGSMGTSTNSGLAEREVNQKVSNLLKQELENKGYTTIITKTSADEFVSNRERGQMARDNNANLILKIHNDGDGPSDGMIFYHSNAGVIETKKDVKNEINEFVSRRDDSIIAQDLAIAKSFKVSFEDAVNEYDIKYSNGTAYPVRYLEHPTNSGFGYTYNIPTSLIEMSSMRVAQDAEFISNEENYSKLAKAIADAVEDYMPPASNGGCGGIAGLETPPGITGPDSNGYYLFPLSGLDSVITGYYGASDPSCNHWGSIELNQVIYTVAKAFAAQHPNNKMQIGDFNSSGHDTHNDGRDADIDIPGGMEVDGSGYNRQLAIDAAKLFFQTGTIKWIYYSDGVVNSEINAWAEKNNLPGQMKEKRGHNNHFHVRMQDKYAGTNHSPSCSGSSG